MGGIGYATEADLLGVLERMDASLLALILSVCPALVMLGAIALGRETATTGWIAALVIASDGTALVLGGAITFGLIAALQGGPNLDFAPQRLALGDRDRLGQHGRRHPDLLRRHGARRPRRQL